MVSPARLLAWLAALVAGCAAACGSPETRRSGLIGLVGVEEDDAECSTDDDCPGPRGECGAPKCYDGECGLNNRPIGDSCEENGGSVCDGAGQCVECTSGAHCSSGVCVAHVCAALTCDDGLVNGGETDVDCGGACPAKCPPEAGCAVDADCIGGACDPVAKSCAPTCIDGAQNGAETDLDCGGPCPMKCTVGFHCSVNADCVTMNCVMGHCFP